jgi:diguanylate cyclase (GGDEF)-like protein
MFSPVCHNSAYAVAVEEQLLYADKVKDKSPSVVNDVLNSISNELLSPKQLELYQYLSAYSQFKNQNVEEAVSAMNKLSEEAITKIKYRALISLVDFHTLSENWNEGINSANKLSKHIETLTDITIKNLAYASLSVFFNKVGDLNAAISHSQKLLNQSTPPEQICLAKANLLVAQIVKQFQTVSKSNVVDGIEDCQGEENLKWKHTIIAYYSKLFLKNSEAKAAITQLSEALPEVERNGNTFLIAQFYALLGQAYLDIGDYNNANLFASQSISTYGLRNDQESALIAFKTLFQVAQYNNNSRQALIFHKSYIAASTAYFQNIRSRQLAIQQYQLDTLEKQTQLVLLDRENDLLKTQIQLEQKSLENNQLSLALAVSLIILLIFWSYRSRRSQIKLKQLANSDELTGIATRSYFRHVANIALQQSKEVKHSACFILFDLDNFKQVNDKFGHLAGDLVLKNAAKVVESACRPSDLVARMGGEEFAILVNNCSLEQAVKIAEQCRTALQELTFENDYPGLKVSASFGVADTVQCGYLYDKIFGSADAALYKAKACGRNKVYVFNNEQPTL